jgi:hypothetical protein
VGAVSRIAALLAAVTAGVAFASAAGAATAPNFHLVKFGGDAWTNYDITAQGTQSVDWPVDLIFWGNATRSKVYNQMRWIWSGSTIYAQVDDGAGAVWVGTGGRKNTLCTDTHFRLYADGDGYLSNALLGNYVIGTAHLDRNECSSSPTFGYNETAEANVAARARAVWGASAIQEDARLMPDGTPTLALFDNANTTTQGNHHFANDGYPTLIHVP